LITDQTQDKTQHKSTAVSCMVYNYMDKVGALSATGCRTKRSGSM